MWKYFLAVVLIAVVTACGGAAGEETDALPSDPGEAMLQIDEYALDDQWARLWEHLHPAHQEIAARNDFISCGDTAAAPLISARVIEVFDETLDVARIGETETKAVTVERSMGRGDDEITQRETSHLIDVDGAWRWMLNNDSIDSFAAGDCPNT